MSRPLRLDAAHPAGAAPIRRGWVRLGDGRAHYAEAGEGPAVVVASGLGLSTRFYEPALAAFARAGLRLIAPDLPGCGRTPGPATGLSVPRMAEWLLDFADALALGRPGWLGHSVGCQVALEVAATHPGRASALVLAAPTGAPLRYRLLRQVAVLARAAVREPPSLLWAVARDYVRVLPSAYIGSWIRAGRDQPVDKLESVRCPVLVLVGERDPIPRPAFIARLLDGVAHARAARVRGGGHGLPRDAVQAFTAAAAPFLRAHAEGAALSSTGEVG